MWDGLATVNLTGYWNGTGNPSMSVPFGYTDAGLPLGVEITGAAFDEAAVLKVGHAFQQSTDYHLRQAPVLIGELQPAE
jgi:aspartyl-tRNA(Asn)/glutamyl-tRNA(Gln) amidotransferase subunit A